MSAATHGLEWTKSSLASVRTNLKSETTAVMKHVNSVSGGRIIDDVAQLHRRGVLLRDQNTLLLRLFKQFTLQVERIQQINGEGGSDRLLEFEVPGNVCPPDYSENTDMLMTTGLHVTNSEAVVHKKRARDCDNAAISCEASCTLDQHMSKRSQLLAASIRSTDENISDTHISGTLCDVTTCTGSMNERLDTRPTYDNSDCHETATTGTNCWTRPSDYLSHLPLSHRPTSAACTQLPGSQCTDPVTYSHIDCDGDDHTVDVGLTSEPPTVDVSHITAAATGGSGSTLSVPSFSPLTVHNGLLASQPGCELTEPSAKKLRLPPPSPSLLSASSGSPPLSPFSRPVCPPTHQVPSYIQTAHVNLPISQQTTVTRMLPAFSSLSGQSSKTYIISNVPHSTGLLTSVSSASPALAVTQLTADRLSSQSSQKSVMKTSQKPCFSLKQLIAAGIIHPGHNVLSVRNKVIFCHLSAYNVFNEL